MAVNINLYPPIVNTYVPAFLVNETCRLYFSLSPYNTMENIENVQVTLRNQNTNNSMLDPTLYPSEIMLTQLHEDIERKSNDRFYIEINPSDTKYEQWDINTYYRVQLRFTKKGISAPETNQLDSWLTENMNNFSEWSTVCLIRGISQPTLTIDGVTNDLGEMAWSLANTAVVGKLVFANEEETDTLKTYQVKLYDIYNNLLTDSGILYASNYNDINSFNYVLKYNFSVDERYNLVINYSTMAGYSASTEKNFLVTQKEVSDIEISIYAKEDPENGRIGVTIKRTKDASEVSGAFVIRRCSSKDNFMIWEDMYYYPFYGRALNLTWYDTTIESDIWYKYSVQAINENNERGMYKELKVPLLISFEDMFLTVQDKQLKIKFNPTVSSYKRVVQESKTDTIGSKYPFIRRNGYAEYIQFPIGGMISFFMDEDELFTSRAELFGNTLRLYSDYNDTHRVGNENNYIYERKFRDKVIDFLYDGEVKLFRSPTEGNMLVRIMDASLTPNQQVGRYLWSFSATAYEIADCTIEQLRANKILKGRDE